MYLNNVFQFRPDYIIISQFLRKLKPEQTYTYTKKKKRLEDKQLFYDPFKKKLWDHHQKKVFCEGYLQWCNNANFGDGQTSQTQSEMNAD